MGRLPGRDCDLSSLHCDAAGPHQQRKNALPPLHQVACTTVETSVTTASASNPEKKHTGETMVRKESCYFMS